MTGIAVTYAPPQSPEWLAARMDGIGGSDIATLLGLNPYKTPTQLWLDKTGRGEPFTGNYATDRGHYLEPFLLDCYRANRDRVIIDTAPDDIPSIIAHPEVHAARVSLDALAHDEHGTYVVEAKTVGRRAASHWDNDDMPEAYKAQVGYQLAVTGLDVAHVVADVAGEYQERIVEADPNFTAFVLDEVATWWWRHVHPEGPQLTPDPDPVRDRDVMAQVWTPDTDADPVVLDSVLVAQLRDTKAALAAARTDYEVAAATVQAAMADATEALDVTGCAVATWRPTKPRRSLDTKRLREDGLYEQYAVTGEPGRTFRVK